VACHACHGSGGRDGAKPMLCPNCHGRGIEQEGQGLFAISRPCRRCHGEGTVVDDPCPECQGSGREIKLKRYNIKIPAGVKEGTRIRLKGKGEPGFGGAPDGDLYVVCHVKPSPLYERRGDNLLLDVPIHYHEAALGATVQVPTPKGAVSLKIPAGSQPGRTLRIRGRGMPKLGGKSHGDVLARLAIQVPQELGKEERRLLESLRDLNDLHARTGEQGRRRSGSAAAKDRASQSKSTEAGKGATV
jgi:molecular chaperone DnaJ